MNTHTQKSVVLLKYKRHRTKCNTADAETDRETYYFAVDKETDRETYHFAAERQTILWQTNRQTGRYTVLWQTERQTGRHPFCGGQRDTEGDIPFHAPATGGVGRAPCVLPGCAGTCPDTPATAQTATCQHTTINNHRVPISL